MKHPLNMNHLKKKNRRDMLVAAEDLAVPRDETSSITHALNRLEKLAPISNELYQFIRERFGAVVAEKERDERQPVPDPRPAGLSDLANQLRNIASMIEVNLSAIRDFAEDSDL